MRLDPVANPVTGFARPHASSNGVNDGTSPPTSMAYAQLLAQIMHTSIAAMRFSLGRR
jgi:hypothetical protein